MPESMYYRKNRYCLKFLFNKIKYSIFEMNPMLKAFHN